MLVDKLQKQLGQVITQRPNTLRSHDGLYKGHA